MKAEPYPAELIERREVSANLAVFRFLPTEQTTFTAGQYATIGVVVDGDVIEWPYSIVSSPGERFLEFTLVRFTGPDLHVVGGDLPVKSAGHTQLFIAYVRPRGRSTTQLSD